MNPAISEAKSNQAVTDVDTANSETDEEDSIVTTQIEFEGFYIVRSILRDLVGSNRVFMRDAKSYCSILLDDNNRKTICRLRFNNHNRLVLGLMNGKDEVRTQIDTPDDIYNYSAKIIEHVNSLIGSDES